MHLNFKENRTYIEQGRGKVRISREPWALIGLVALVALAPLVFGLQLLGRYEERKQLTAVATSLEGEHVSAYKTGSGKNRRYLITYAYRLDGARHTHTEEVSRRFYKAHKEGGHTYDLRYDPKEPENMMFAYKLEPEAIQALLIGSIFFGVIELFGLLLLSYLLWLRWKVRRVLRDGRLLPVRVVNSRISGGKISRIYIKFLGEGAGIQGTIRESVRGRSKDDLPEEGEEIYVLWRDDQQFVWL